MSSRLSFSHITDPELVILDCVRAVTGIPFVTCVTRIASGSLYLHKPNFNAMRSAVRDAEEVNARTHVQMYPTFDLCKMLR